MMGNMSKPVPLSSILRIQYIDIILREILLQWLGFVLESLSSEIGILWDVQGKISSGDLSRPVSAAAVLTQVGVRRFKRPT